KLREGEPGQSHALEIAKRYGLPERIIESAKALLGGIKVEFDNLIADLNEKRLRYEKGLEQLGNDQKKWEEKNMLAQKTLFDAEHQKKDLLAKAYREAASLISDTKRQMRSFLDEMKKLEKTKMREVITQVETKQDEVVQKLREFEISDYGSPSLEDIRRGDVVFVRSLGYDASVLGVDLRHKRVRLRSGGIEIEVPVTDIGFKIGKSAEIKPEALHMDLLEKVASSRLNLVGLRVDEALSRLEPFLNHASLGGLSEVIIIHGFGTGILANAVREHLTGHPLVKHFRSGIQSEGGAGITVVTIT
ncbi:MAG TPA: Smr/MutS family protein, partial [Thermodesulfovibrionales bacterium]|nr:Smr/MutS family protein [Thermodesulfovibrionales bacterium]